MLLPGIDTMIHDPAERVHNHGLRLTDITVDRH
jgi:hypothetical protein